MVFDVSKVTGIGDFTTKKEKDRELCFKNDHVFLVINKSTIEVRSDHELIRTLIEKYESVMESRYFGRGGIEIVLAGKQFTTDELNDLVRLSYNLTD